MNKKEGALPWTPEEDTVLLEAYSEVGNKWTCISRMLPGRTDNAVKNRHALLQRKRCSQRQGSATHNRKRSKAEPAAAALPSGRYEEGLHHAPFAHQYSYIQPSEFYAGMPSAPIGTDAINLHQQHCNLQLLSHLNMQQQLSHSQQPGMQQFAPSLQHLRHSFQQPTLFQSQACISPEQYSILPSSMYGLGPGNMGPVDNPYGVLGMLGEQTAHPRPVALGVATGRGTERVTADSIASRNSAGTVTGHPSFFRQNSLLSTDVQPTQDMDGSQPVSVSDDPFQECAAQMTSSQQK